MRRLSLTLVTLLLALTVPLRADVVTLAWDPNQPSESVTGYRLSYGTAAGAYTTVVDVGNVTTWAVTVPGGARYYFVVQAYSAIATGPNSAEVVDDLSPPPVPLPAPWTSQDVGGPVVPGGTTFASNTFTVQGAGTDIWGTADQFQFVSQSLSGDGEIVARVDSLANTDPFAKGGVMWREDLTPGAPNALVYVSAGNGIIFSRRVARDGASTSTSATALIGVAPFWVRLVRSGATVTAYASATGTAWTTLGAVSVPMASNALVGLAVTSLLPAASTTGVFSSVSVTVAGPMGPPLAPDSVEPRKFQ